MDPNGDHTQAMKKPRPKAVSFVAVSMGLNAAVCAGAAVNGFNNFRLHPRQAHLLAGGLVFGVLAFVFAGVTRGLWKLSSSARRVAVILAVLDVLFALASDVYCIHEDWVTYHEPLWTEAFMVVLQQLWLCAPLYILTRREIIGCFNQSQQRQAQILPTTTHRLKEAADLCKQHLQDHYIDEAELYEHDWGRRGKIDDPIAARDIERLEAALEALRRVATCSNGTINMSIAPEPILRAGNDTVYWACVFCRNQTLREDVPVKMINDVMEAIHEVPGMLIDWEHHDLAELRMHLGCFDASRWPGAPNLLPYFNMRLKEFGYDEREN